MYSAADGHRTKAPWTRFHTTAVRFFLSSLVHNCYTFKLTAGRNSYIPLSGGLTTRDATHTFFWPRDTTRTSPIGPYLLSPFVYYAYGLPLWVTLPLSYRLCSSHIRTGVSGRRPLYSVFCFVLRKAVILKQLTNILVHFSRFFHLNSHFWVHVSAQTWILLRNL
jgi:hypothetical protein